MIQLEKMDDFFHRRLEGYDEHMLNNIDGAKEFYPFTAASLPLNKPIRLLDLGCGTGLELEYIFKLNDQIEVTCIDLAEGMLNELKKKFSDKNIKVICDSYFDVEFEPCDAVVSVESLHHFTQQEKIPLYKKLYDALSDGGCFVLTDYFALSDEEELMHRNTLNQLRKAQQIPDDVFVHYDTPLTVSHEIKALKCAGFSTVELLKSWGATSVIKAVK